MSANDTFLSIKGWETVEIALLRALLNRELHRRMGAVMVGRAHTEEEIKVHDEKAAAPTQAAQGGRLEPGAEAMGVA